MLFLKPILLDQMKNANFFSDAISWFFLFLNVCLIVGGYLLYKQLTKKFAEENKKISDKLSDRSYNVMMQKWDLERKNLSISQQNQEILDSLHYAKNIQSAIMPHADSIDRIFKDGFVLYMHKDIVSGDFYYFNKVNSDIFIAAADCTGHGVPGAFMSLVGSKELKIANAISNSPAQILKHLNNGVKDTLRQNHIDGTKDGMDIALVRINGTTVTYSAANRPLWILKNG